MHSITALILGEKGVVEHILLFVSESLVESVSLTNMIGQNIHGEFELLSYCRQGFWRVVSGMCQGKWKALRSDV